jgi:glycosyltransferase AglD
LKAQPPILILVGTSALLALALVLDAASLRQAAGYVLNHPLGLLAAFAAYTASFALRALSWRQLIREGIPLRELFSLIMGALFLNHVAPAKAGDLARMYALARRGVTGERAVTSVVLSRLVDLAGLLAILAVCWMRIGVGGWEKLAYPALPLLGTAVALPVLARLKLPFRFGPVGRYAGRLRGALREVKPTALLRAFTFAVPAWVLEAGILLFVARGIGMELSFSELVAATCFAVLIASVPFAPGALGTYEAGMVVVLILFGVAPELAFTAAVATHAVKFSYAFAAAPFALGEGLAAVRNGKMEPDDAGVEV